MPQPQLDTQPAIKSAHNAQAVSPVSLSERYAYFFDLVRHPRRRKTPYDNIYFMCMDAEWFESAGRNVVLSYQIATVSQQTDNNIIEYMLPDQRLSLADIVELGIRSVNDGNIPESHRLERNLVILISHHVTAEWSVLADRKEPHITKHLDVIRKSPVTGITPIEITVADRLLTDVHIYDTRLLAPATHQKLSELSKLLGDDNDLKIDIPHYYKKRMDLFRRDHSDEYERYALQDSKVTLKLFFLLQESLMSLAGKKKLYRTLASAAVTGYLGKALNFAEYQDVLSSKDFEDAYKLARRGYHGGRNEGFIIGRTDSKNNPETNERLWVDIDFVGCYPTAMALCPMIDCNVDPFKKREKIKRVKRSSAQKALSEQSHPAMFAHDDDSTRPDDQQQPWILIDQIPLRYRLKDRTDDQIRDMGINPEYYHIARAALTRAHLLGQPGRRKPAGSKESPDFDTVMIELRKKKGGKIQAKRIREAALDVDNRLINKWHRAWAEAKSNGDSRVERFIIPGIARVRFDFQGTTIYPCLPVPHRYYGLIFPMRGETVATAPEIMLALEAGAKVESLSSVELPMVLDDEGLPKRLFFDHLARLTKDRAAMKQKSRDRNLSPEERQNAEVYERLLKEFLNSFYGKSAQAINYRKTYQPSTGEMVALQSSLITEPSAAALTTGLARAALAATLMAVEKFNKDKPPERKILVISGTTDGLLIGLPRPPGINLLDDHYYKQKDNGIKFNDEDVKLPDILELCGCHGLMELITSYLPIRQMRNSRKELTDGNETFLEIKHMADDVLSVKTRGQVGWVRDGDDIIITILAKFGHKPPLSEIVMGNDTREGLSVDELKEREERYKEIFEGGGTKRHTIEGKWIMEILDRIEKGEEGIFEYTFFGLNGFNDIMKSEDDIDLVQKVGKRRFNGDFDWKRKLVTRSDGSVSVFTEPFSDITEMLTYRYQMQAERRRGKNARPEKVIHRVEVRGRKTRARGGDPATVVRMFLRGILHGFIPWQRKRQTSARIAERLNNAWNSQGYTIERSPKQRDKNKVPPPLKSAWIRDDVENAKRFKPEDWEPGIILPAPKLRTLLEALAAEFNVDYESAACQIFTGDLHDEIHKGLALQVALAVIHAPGRGISPFKELYLKGQLPVQEDIARALHPHLSEQDVEACRSEQFHTGQCMPGDRPRIERFFRLLGLSPGKAAAGARILAPPIQRVNKTPRNPAVKKCMELFLQAVTQPDIMQREIGKQEILDRLKRYGLQQSRFYTLRNAKFTPRTLSDTPANRSQITKMAKSLGLDPLPILESLLDR